MTDRIAVGRRARGGCSVGAGARRGARRPAGGLEPLESRVLLSTVVGRFVFYNESALDGNGAAADERDVAAIAPDKAALLPGHAATFANYTGYSRGINGVAVDVAASAGDGAPGALGPHDLIFRAGTGADPGQWAPAPAPAITRLAPAPGSGTVRYLLTWPAGAIRNEWLQVTIRPGAATGLAVPDVFYFGNVPGDTGGSTAAASVDALDVTRVRQRLGGAAADSAEACDVNRDGRVNALDVAVVRAGVGKPALPLFTPPVPDFTAPVVSITSPDGAAPVHGVVSVVAAASDNVGVAAVQFLLDGRPLGDEDVDAPFSVSWDTTGLDNGVHHLAAVARDAAGNTSTSPDLSVTVDNPDIVAPAVALTAPAAGATIAGTVPLSADASDNVGVVGVQFFVDGQPVGAEDPASPYSITWDSRTVAEGGHTLAARARDAAGNLTTSASRAVTVSNLLTGPAAVGQWSPVMDWPLVAINQVLLNDGRVLMWDGDGSGECIGSPSARVYDPASNQFTPVPIPWFSEHEDDIFCSAQTLLADGRVLVVGGHDCDGPGLGIHMSALFDPKTLSWTRGPDMHYARWYPTATTLSDGRVLVLGGSDMTNDDYNSIPEVYDPVANTFATLPGADLPIPSYSWVSQLPDGRVIVTGSDERKGPTYALDLATQTWSTVDPAVLDHGSGVMYRPGQFMKAGSSYVGAPEDNGGDVPSKATTYVLDMTQPSPLWQQTESMAYARTHLNLTMLPDGDVLAIGGSSNIGGLTASRGVLPAELWSPVSKTWKTLASMQTPRMYHSTSLLLPDGRVLVAGGGRLSVAEDFLNAEIFSPGYLFRGPRPSITSAPSALTYGSGFFVGTPDAARVASVALVRNGAVTHSDNMNQRYLPLAFTVTDGGLTVQAPPDAYTAPPGDYMLFVVDTDGVPSVAPFVRFAAPYEDSRPPTAPTNLTASGTTGSARLRWTAATDDVGVASYDVYRSTSSGFVPSPQNRVGSTSSNGFTDSLLAAGTYYYVVRAVDAAGNVGPSSNEASAVVAGDSVPPTVSLTSPAPAATVSGSVDLTAEAADNVGVFGVRFLVDGTQVGAEDTAAPYTFSWSSGSVPNGAHEVIAVARDVSGNETTSQPVQVDVQNVTPSGLVAAWSFDEGSGGVAHDVTGRGHAGTIFNATWSAAGKYGGALEFNDEDSWVTVDNAPDLMLAGGMTLEAWVRPDVLDSFETVILKERGGDHLSYALYAHDPDRPDSGPDGWVNTDTGADLGAGAVGALPLNVWTHLAATYDGATVRLYINGVLSASKAVDGDITETDDVLRIGGNGVWGEFFSGLIDEVRIYNRPLTRDEIVADSQNALPATPPPAAAARVAGGSTLAFPAGTFSDRRAMAPRRAWYETAASIL